MLHSMKGVGRNLFIVKLILSYSIKILLGAGTKIQSVYVWLLSFPHVGSSPFNLHSRSHLRASSLFILAFQNFYRWPYPLPVAKH